SPESRLRAKNLDKSLFEVAPRDPLAAKLRQLADSLCVTRGERRSLLSWLGRAKAALL
ncbi:pilus assembly protein, partial [Pseudomonas aeruginosa]